jgi:hypothetical protein
VEDVAVIAAVPTIGEAPQLPALVEALLEGGASSVLLTVNEERAVRSVSAHAAHHRVHVLPIDGSIYEGWNTAMRFARNIEPGARLALLNDDLTLHEGAMAGLERLMDQHPDVAVMGFDYRPDAPRIPQGIKRVQGTFRNNGVHGCALCVDPGRVREVDPMFEWWYGDDDLVLNAIADGHGVAIAEGCRVTHVGEGTASKRPWTDAAKLRDQARFLEKWGDR